MKGGIFAVILFSYVMVFAGTGDSLFIQIENSSGVQKVKLLHKAIRQSYYVDEAKTEKLSLEAVKLSEELKVDSLIAYSHYYLGLAYYFKSYWKLSAEQYQIAFNNPWTDTNITLKSAIANNIAIDYEFLVDYDKAAEYYYKGLKIKENTDDSLFTAKSYMNLGLLFIETHEFQKAKENFLKSLHVFQNLNDERHIAGNYQNLGIVEYLLGDSSAGVRYFEKAVKLALKVKDSLQISDIYHDFGTQLLDRGKYSQALEKFKLSMEFEKPDVRPSSYYINIEKIGECYLGLNNLNKAENYLTKALDGLDEDHEMWLSNTNLALARLYAKTGEWKKFNSHLDAYNDIRNKILKKEEYRSLSEMQVAYDTEKKNTMLELQGLEIASQNQKLIFTASVTVFLIIVSVLLLFSRNKIKERNRELLIKNIELSERWNRIQQFYLNIKIDQYERNEESLFAQITKLINEEQLFAKNDLVVEDFAKRLNTNIKYVSAAIKERTNMNFNTFINTYRIEEAKKILSDEINYPWTMEAIAEQCGFNNTTSFFQAFKKITGLTPASYRKIAA